MVRANPRCSRGSAPEKACGAVGAFLRVAFVQHLRSFHAPRSTLWTKRRLPRVASLTCGMSCWVSLLEIKDSESIQSQFRQLRHPSLGHQKARSWQLRHLSLGQQKATLGTFGGTDFGRFGLESCWGSAVSQPCSTEHLADELAPSTGRFPNLWHVLLGFAVRD